jgi:hypothetical protein
MRFVKGRILSGQFYSDAIRPLLANIPHDACLVGEGSDVLGYDQPVSMDHDWGPRLTLFMADESEAAAIRGKIIANLPESFQGFPLRRDENASNIVVTTVPKWLRENLSIADIDALKISNWLSFPQQHLLQFTGGTSFADLLGHYMHAKKILSWYPNDVWRWMMASQWYLIWSTERLIFRTEEAGDSFGSQLIVHKLIRLIVEMCFLQHRQYKPYDKWLGTAFQKIDIDRSFEKTILEAVSCQNVKHQIELLQKMLFQLGNTHNALHLAKAVDPKTVNYEVGVNNAVRPYLIFNSSEYKDACIAGIQNPSLKKLVYTGAIDQMTNVSDAMINFTDWKAVIRRGFETMLP